MLKQKRPSAALRFHGASCGGMKSCENSFQKNKKTNDSSVRRRMDEIHLEKTFDVCCRHDDSHACM